MKSSLLSAVFFVVFLVGGVGRAEERSVQLESIKIPEKPVIGWAYNEFSGCKLLFMNDGEVIKPEGEILRWKIIIDQIEVNNPCGDPLSRIFSEVDIRDGRGMIVASVKISPDYPASNITLQPGYICGDGMTFTAEGVLRSDVDQSNKGEKIGLEITTFKVRSLGTGAELQVNGLPILGTEQVINSDIVAPTVQIGRVGGAGGISITTPDVGGIILEGLFFRKLQKKGAIISSIPKTSDYPCFVDGKNKVTWSIIDSEVRGKIYYYSLGNPKIFRPWHLPLPNVVLIWHGYYLVPVKY